MKKIDEIRNKDIDEFAKWLDAFSQIETAPWIQWWNTNYCNNCESIEVYVPAFDKNIKCSWCELEDTCKFFPKMNDVPTNIEILKMWLDLESDNNS